MHVTSCIVTEYMPPTKYMLPGINEIHAWKHVFLGTSIRMAVKRLANHHVSTRMTACIKSETLVLEYQGHVSGWSRMCVIVRCALLKFAQQSEQCKSVCFQRRFAVQMQNQELFCLCFLILFSSVYACECWDMHAMPAPMPGMKRSQLAASFDGRTCLKTALFSKISHRLKCQICVSSLSCGN
jgi:hypothetical protein